jgi:hypothetical protein
MDVRELDTERLVVWGRHAVAAIERYNQVLTAPKNSERTRVCAAARLYAILQAIERELNPKRLRFDDDQRKEFFGPSMLVSRLENVRDAFDEVIIVLDAPDMCHDHDGGKFWKEKKALAQIPSPAYETLRAAVERLADSPKPSSDVFLKPHWIKDPVPKREHSRWDEKTEARNRWIYKECCKCTVYSSIILQLSRNAKGWKKISTAGGIRRAAQEYAKRLRLADPPLRQSSRRPGNLRA